MVNLRLNNTMGPVDRIVQKLKLLAGGKTRRFLFREGLVDENGIPTKEGRTLQRRLAAEEWYADDKNTNKLAEQLREYTKLSKEETEDK